MKGNILPTRLGLALALTLLSATLASAQPGGPLPAPLPLFPADNWWNTDVSAAPVDPHSAAYINFLGSGVGLHPDFGGDSDPSPAWSTSRCPAPSRWCR
jgi:hypothetical protein